jgi:hypothetical protein
MRLIVASILLSLLVSCSGPVFIARTEQEAIKRIYLDPKLNDLSEKNQDTLRNIYQRYQMANVDIYPDGIGFTSLESTDRTRYRYLLVDLRPRNITFGEGQTTADQRLAEVVNHHIQKNLRYLTAKDLERTGVDGLAFIIHWPVRDLSQCDKHGGFLEYVSLYLSRTDFSLFIDREISFSEAIERAEVSTSQGLKKANTIKVILSE